MGGQHYLSVPTQKGKQGGGDKRVKQDTAELNHGGLEKGSKTKSKTQETTNYHNKMESEKR